VRVITGDDGRFSVAVNPGAYSVQISAAGFKTVSYSNVNLSAALRVQLGKAGHLSLSDSCDRFVSHGSRRGIADRF
jgi:hypothetical protein